MHDVNAQWRPIEARAFYIMDRGYLDFERLYAMDQAGGFFITRAKRNLDARRVYSALVDRDAELDPATRPLLSTASMPPSTTPPTCVASVIAIPRPARTWCS